MTSQNGKLWKFHHVCNFLPAPLVSGLWLRSFSIGIFLSQRLRRLSTFMLQIRWPTLGERNYKSDSKRISQQIGMRSRHKPETAVATWTPPPSTDVVSFSKPSLSVQDKLILGPSLGDRPVGNYSPQIPLSASLGKHFLLYANKLCTPDPAAWGRKKQFSTQVKQIIFPTCGYSKWLFGFFCLFVLIKSRHNSNTKPKQL